MQRLENTYTGGMTNMNRSPMVQDSGDWGAEINGGSMNEMATADQMQWPDWQSPNMNRPQNEQMMNNGMQSNGMMNGNMQGNGMMNGNMQSNGMMNGNMQNNGMVHGDLLAESMQNHLSDDVVNSPTTMEEAYRGSMKRFLSQNKGNYIVATFLIGTQGTAEFEGILYEVGNDYMVIYQQGRDRYIVVDIYSLKYVEFYDTERREICNELLRQQGMWPLQNRPEYA